MCVAKQQNIYKQQQQANDYFLKKAAILEKTYVELETCVHY